jgi:hypothetical protein
MFGGNDKRDEKSAKEKSSKEHKDEKHKVIYMSCLVFILIGQT